jgi:hypothetical protein
MADGVDEAEGLGRPALDAAQGAFIDGLNLPDLGFGASMAFWGFRACARGQAMCCAVIHGFERVFEDDAPAVLAALLTLSRQLGGRGRRKIGLAAPGCAGVTADELSIAAVFAAAQTGDVERRDAHLAWLFAGRVPTGAATAADRLGLLFEKRSIKLRARPHAVGAERPGG